MRRFVHDAGRATPSVSRTQAKEHTTVMFVEGTSAAVTQLTLCAYIRCISTLGFFGPYHEAYDPERYGVVIRHWQNWQ